MPKGDSVVSRVALTISYDGTEFAGSQVQPGVRTVQAELNARLATIFGREVSTVFAGRTDRGVHAAGQVVGCWDARPDLENGTIAASLNALLPADIAVNRVERCADEFHPRFDAKRREYRYRLFAGSRQPLARGVTWQRRGKLNAEAMFDAAGRLTGKRDFAAVAGGGHGVPWTRRDQGERGTTRTLFEFAGQKIQPWWSPCASDDEHLIEFRVVADGFLPRMVRNLMGLLVEVGRGVRPTSWVEEVLATRDRRSGPPTAPPQGLTLWHVSYVA
jgi:tRNA pseudouridine38-40 synthase